MPDEASPPLPDLAALRRVVQDSPVPTMVLHGPGHRVAYANAALCEVTGRGEAALNGRTARECFPRQALAGQLRVLDQARTRGAAQLRYGVPLRLRPGADARFWNVEVTPFEGGSRPGLPCLLVQLRDVTAQQQALRSGEQARATLDALFEHIPEGLLMAEGRGVRLRRASAHGLRMAGVEWEEVSRRAVEMAPALWQVYHPDGERLARAEELPLTRAARHGETVQHETWLLRQPDGRMVPILCSAGPVRDAAGRVTGGILAWRDMTELREARAALEAALQAQQQLAREADHRIKNSLQLVAALLRLQAGRAGPEAKEALEAATARVQAVAEAHRALQNSPDLRSVGLADMLRELAAGAATLHPGADVRAAAAEGLQLDAERAIPLALVLSELLGQALRHGHAEGGRGPVHLAARVAGDRLLLEVAENGQCAPAAEAGPDLGETVVRSLTRQVGAALTRSAVPGQGTRVVLDLPLLG